jgi:23S rRNA C2498 (ribose-2'-O)-methylase RlmM
VQESEVSSQAEQIQKLQETLKNLEALAEKVRGLIVEAQARSLDKESDREEMSVLIRERDTPGRVLT